MQTRISQVAVVILGSLAMFALSACQQGAQSFAANRKSQAIPQLQAAEEMDYSKADAAGVDPVSREDFYAQAEAANFALKQLQAGADVPQSKIDDALVVPDEPRSPAATASLIDSLGEARKLDNQGDKDYAVDPVFAQDFDVQDRKAHYVMKNLKAGENVTRIEINDALEVPPNP
ncbi:MAG TPA: hypothetical protein VMA09_21485 [Candidatus Binataceae bacterium]|nr:hypothetical protein [Candidatus Binataceae bacterium]